MNNRASILLLAASATSGCVDFDLEERVEDTRILAMRTEPAEILFSPLYLSPADQRPPFPLPTVDVDVEVFAFDPRGGATTVSMQMCPEGAGDSSCRLYDKDQDTDFARLVEPARSEVAALLEPAVYEDVIAEDVTPVGRIGPNTFRYTITPGAIDFFQPKNAAGETTPTIFPILPRFAVQVENSDAKDAGEEVFKERAFKRLPLSIDLTDTSLPGSFLTDLAAGLGIALCDGPMPEPVDADGDGVDDVFKEGDFGCLYPRVANKNPGLLGFRFESVETPDLLSQGMLTGVPDVGPGSLVRATPGTQLAITPVWADDAVERYQIISFDIDSSKIKIVNRVEDMACQYYSTRGTVSSGQTSLQFNDDRMGIIWTLPSDAEPGERDSVILVALDQRGGTDVAEITVEYR